MPNKPKSYKKNGRRITRTSPRNLLRTDSVKDLLARVNPIFRPISQQKTLQKNWSAYLDQSLGADLAKRVTGVVEREGALVVFTESAAWSMRVRFAIAEKESQIREANPEIEKIVVRVMPRTAPKHR